MFMTRTQDLMIQPHYGGVRITPVSGNSADPSYLFENIFSLPFSVFLINSDSTIVHTNDHGVNLCGFDSLKEAVNCSIRDTAKTISSRKIMHDHQKVVISKRMEIVEQPLILNNNLNHNVLSILFPWYQEQKVRGLFGFSMAYGYHSIDTALIQLINLGLLNKACHAKSSELLLLFTKRERDCIKLLLKGIKIKEIAQVFGLSKRTIEHHIDSIKQKVGVSTQIELILKLSKLFPTDESFSKLLLKNSTK